MRRSAVAKQHVSAHFENFKANGRFGFFKTYQVTVTKPISVGVERRGKLIHLRFGIQHSTHQKISRPSDKPYPVEGQKLFAPPPKTKTRRFRKRPEHRSGNKKIRNPEWRTNARLCFASLAGGCNLNIVDFLCRISLIFSHRHFVQSSAST